MGKDATDKLIAEAAHVGLAIVGPGHTPAYRTYQFIDCGHERELATTAVRQSRFRCQHCLDAKLEGEARANGLELLGPSDRRGCWRYKFKDCGHEIEAQATHVRRDNVRCARCVRAKHESEGAAVGVELIGPGRSAHFRTYRFTVCGHAQEAHVAAVRDGRVLCRACVEHRFAVEARAHGVELLGNGRSPRYRRYRFISCGHDAEYVPSAVRVGVRCKRCIDERHRADGASEHLTLLGPGQSAAYRLYRFDCGHERELTTAAVRLGHVRCQVCFHARLTAEAAAEGLTIVGPASKPTDRTYRFIDCGHEREISVGAVRLGTVRCRECFDMEVTRSAAEHGLEVIGPGRDANYRLYRFKTCGHQREIAPGAVRRGNVFCRECYETALADEARAAGVEIVGKGRTGGSRRYRFIACGHEQEMQLIHVRLEGFHCQTCNDSAWAGQGNVYIVTLRRGDEVLYKVGLAKSVQGRITRYGLKADVEIEITRTQSFADYREAHAREQLMHAALRLAGYGVGHADAREYLTSGFTECYAAVPDEIADRVLEEISEARVITTSTLGSEPVGP